jgi:hypothetical protein
LATTALYIRHFLCRHLSNGFWPKGNACLDVSERTFAPDKPSHSVDLDVLTMTDTLHIVSRNGKFSDEPMRNIGYRISGSLSESQTHGGGRSNSVRGPPRSPRHGARMFSMQDTIQGFDDALWSAIHSEEKRQENHVELIASENYVSPRVLEAQGGVLTNKYA